MVKIMLIQMHLAALLLIGSATPRSPRIYNVLISSKKNLSPSHALPIYEPVLRTTSLGYIFPTLIYQPSIISPIAQYEYNQYQKGSGGENSDGGGNIEGASNIDSPNNIQKTIPKITERDKQVHENKEQLNNKFLPYYNPGPANQKPGPTYAKTEPTDPKQIVANLKRNPEIPDIPPLPLPVRVS
ncbi:uncharacterized protein LOC132695817 isoform X2 [Cylas formicarius]|uniref:uncharacterized protein LOC132695817 isoform X2 n=1 Tax=Cylas formicarius TaxID=197179 RepID=UPI0029589A60|nr:uncharacterized protein LOC132695817 isoform X2 [Cylas formicarius]